MATDVCTICLDKIVARSGRALISCGRSKHTFHLACLRFDWSICPTCRLPFSHTMDVDLYSVQIQNGPSKGEQIEVSLPARSTVAVLGEKLALTLTNASDKDSINFNLHLDPARLTFFSGGVELECSHVLCPGNHSLLVAKVETGHWQDNVQQLADQGHHKLADFLCLHASEQLATGHHMQGSCYQYGALIKLTLKLFDFNPRGPYNCEEEDDEVIEVLLNAQRCNQSMYEALQAEFF
jgi:hypothetical protein